MLWTGRGSLARRRTVPIVWCNAQANIQLNQWVVENRLDYGEHADDDDDDVTSIHLYTVK
jgi:hypothetical protein